MENIHTHELTDPGPDNATVEASSPPLWLALLLTAMAGGMGWGIRGQYGHETGAMIPGVLVALTLVFLFCPNASSLQAARAVAMTAVAFGFGGVMTYGQTVGLTHDTPLIGNWDALKWGMVGLFIKGGLWIGLAGAFLGMGLGGKRYRALEMMLLMFALVALVFLGVALLNYPFNPANHQLPAIYFSDDWRWEPNNPDVKPRFETWGGLLVAWMGLLAYVGLVKKDRLARNMGLIGVLAGGFGFTIGQSLQAAHAWNVEWYRTGPLAPYDPYINWWNMMETTFGLVLGFGLALGLWLNQKLIAINEVKEEVDLSIFVEWPLVIIHAIALSLWSFYSIDKFDSVAGLPLVMGIFPLICITGGRYWPYMLTLPLLALPIAGKTLRAMSYESGVFSLNEGWAYFIVIPMAVTLVAAVYYMVRGVTGQPGRTFTRQTLVLVTWLYMGLNFAFFDFPWPWSETTGRTYNANIFAVCAVTLTLAALFYDWQRVYGRMQRVAFPVIEAPPSDPPNDAS